MAGLFVASGHAGAKDPDLTEIADKLKRWRSSFVTMRLVWVSWNPQYLKDRQAASPSRYDRFSRGEFTWSDVGAARSEWWSYADGRLRHHVYDGANARTRTAFRAKFPEAPEKPGFLSQLDLLDMASPEPKTTWSVTPLQDVYRGFESRWLGDRLAQGSGKLEGYEELDGARCARLTIDYAALWLDTTHDFLVRRVRPAVEGVAAVLFDVEEFQRVPPGIWFPKRGTICSTPDPANDTRRWLVHEVALNEVIPLGRFDPPAPMVGTHVVDARTRKSYIFGEKRAGELREGEMAAAAQKNLSQSDFAASAETPQSRIMSWSAVLLCGSVLLLLMGIVISLRRRSG